MLVLSFQEGDKILFISSLQPCLWPYLTLVAAGYLFRLNYCDIQGVVVLICKSYTVCITACFQLLHKSRLISLAVSYKRVRLCGRRSWKDSVLAAAGAQTGCVLVLAAIWDPLRGWLCDVDSSGCKTVIFMCFDVADGEISFRIFPTVQNRNRNAHDIPSRRETDRERERCCWERRVVHNPRGSPTKCSIFYIHAKRKLNNHYKVFSDIKRRKRLFSFWVSLVAYLIVILASLGTPLAVGCANLDYTEWTEGGEGRGVKQLFLYELTNWDCRRWRNFYQWGQSHTTLTHTHTEDRDSNRQAKIVLAKRQIFKCRVYLDSNISGLSRNIASV